MFPSLPDSIRGNKKVALYALSNKYNCERAVKAIPGDLLKDKDLILSALAANSELLKVLPKELKEDKV